MGSPNADNDIQAYLLYEYKEKENKYAIGSINKDRFIEVDEPNVEVIMQAIKLMNGKYTCQVIEEKVLDSTGQKINVENLCNILERADLIQYAGRNIPEKSEYDSLSLKLFEFKLEKIQKIFLKLSKFVIPFSFITIFAFLFSILIGISDRKLLIGKMSLLGFTNNYILNIITIFFIMAISVFFHEIAHGVVAAKFGLKPKKITVSLYLYISPIIYIKIPGLYTIKPNQRIAVWFAGIAMNFLLFNIGFTLSIILKQLGVSIDCINILNYFWYINLILIVTNLSPLLPLDGYFMLATLLKIPNLRKKSFESVKNSIKKRRIEIKGMHFIYFMLSISAMCLIVGQELFAMVNLFVEGFHRSIFYAFWNIKQYLILIVIIIFIRIPITIKRKQGS